jgi:hypothetical protein
LLFCIAYFIILLHRFLQLDAAADKEGTLDKEATSYDDIFDAYRLALEFYHHKLD